MSSNANMSKAEKRDAAREQARQLREAQAKREKRTRNLIIIGLIALVAVVSVVIAIIVRQGNEKANTSAIESVEKIPANTSVTDGGISLGADLVAGTENVGAPVLDVYLDFTCIYCAQFEEINAADIDQFVAAGDATVIYHPVSILDRTGDFSGFSGRAAQAVAVVADQAPEAYNDFQAGLFALYRNAAATEGSTAGEPTDADIAATAAEAGVPQAVVATITDGTFTAWVAATTEQFGNDGYTGTPTVLLDGEVFNTWTEPGALAAAVRKG
ncbi:MAG: DsbA family protein [Georgenia sp.]